ncbi:MAG: anti-sigma factor antagonist [Erysipelotrichia bacterium]|nr:anti-sigma factor antagonist [Erysipelotrichia bacterium]
MIDNLLNILVSDETPGQITIQLKGEIDQLNTKTVKAELDKRSVQEAQLLIFDLEEVEFMASAGLAIFAYYQDLFNKSGQGQKLKVINCNQGVFRIFHLTRLDEMLDVSEKL